MCLAERKANSILGCINKSIASRPWGGEPSPLLSICATASGVSGPYFEQAFGLDDLRGSPLTSSVL